MFPIGDDNSGITGPALITIALILANIAVFVLCQGLGSNDAFTYAFSTVPAEILSGQDVARSVTITDPLSGDPAGKFLLQPTPIPVYLTLITSMFMHGGFMHLFGNMLFLWIFGDNLEHAMGKLKFLMFYLLCGIAAGLAQVFTTSMSGGNELLPMLGASGAISGVLGGYMLLFPHRRVRVLLMRMITDVPAYVALGLWFVFQLISGMGVLGDGSQVGGVAYAAHIGGFIAGVLLVRLFANKETAAAKTEARAFQHMR
jgi:membrane associated rhomboid family serine protease